MDWTALNYTGENPAGATGEHGIKLEALKYPTVEASAQCLNVMT